MLRGLIVVPLDHIYKVRSNSHDKYVDKILAWEGIKDKVAFGQEIGLSGWQEVFNDIKSASGSAIVESEYPHTEQFCIGPISKASNQAVFMRHFNASGYLDDELTRIPYEEITLVVFDDHYINTFSKYLRKKEKKGGEIEK